MKMFLTLSFTCKCANFFANSRMPNAISLNCRFVSKRDCTCWYGSFPSGSTSCFRSALVASMLGVSIPSLSFCLSRIWCTTQLVNLRPGCGRDGAREDLRRYKPPSSKVTSTVCESSPSSDESSNWSRNGHCMCMHLVEFLTDLHPSRRSIWIHFNTIRLKV